MPTQSIESRQVHGKSLMIFGSHDDATISQISTCLADGPVARGVICADGHKGYAQPVGGVVAYYDHVSLSGVGFDIACGVKGVKTDLKWSDIKKDASKISDEMASSISFGIGKTNNAGLDHELFDDESWKINILRDHKEMARQQLSSCGSGNHWVNVFADDEDNVWIGCHFGSRGLGHKTASHYLLVSGGRDGMDVPPCILSTKSNIGTEYLAAMELCGRYAYAGRDIVCQTVADMLGAKILDEVHNHHNFAWKETHNNTDLWVVRKGATPSFPGQRGVVGSSMGGRSAIVRGIDSQVSKDALYSTVHGSGRLMSRTQAAGKVKWIRDEKTGKKHPQRVAEGLINEASMRQKIKDQGIELRGGGADESPDVYRNLEEVLEHHKGTVEIECWLNPKIVLMAGADTFDPYKD